MREQIEKLVRDMQLAFDLRVDHAIDASYALTWATRLAAIAQGVGEVTDEMVERALRHRAFQEDGAQWPEAYSDEEQRMERENMRALLAAAHKTDGPQAYCRACEETGMSNCGHFDECAGATCITCHRPLNTPPPPHGAKLKRAEARRNPPTTSESKQLDWRPIAEAPRDGRPLWVRGNNYGSPKKGRHFCWAHWDGTNWIASGVGGETLLYLTDYMPGA